MEKTDKEAFIIFNSIGNPDKDLIGTAVVYSIKEAYPRHKIIVITNFPEIWLHNPQVYRVYKAGLAPYFYDDFVDGKDSFIFWQNPYNSSDVILKKKHIIEAWCDLCNVPFKKIRPHVFLTQREHEVTRKILGLVKPTNPIFLIQTHSEAFPGQTYVWDRDIPTKIGEKVVMEMTKLGYKTLQLCTGKEPVLSNAQPIRLDLRQTLCAISFSDSRLLINSFSQHAASAMGKKSAIFWVGQDPTLAGYPLHVNIIPDSTNKLGQFVSTWNEIYQSDAVGEVRPPFPVEDFYSPDDIVNQITNI